MKYALHEAGCTITEHDQGPRAAPGLFPSPPIERRRIHTGANDVGSFSHNAQLAEFKNRFYLVWSTGQRDEAFPGQRIMIASSDDGRQWSPARTLVAGDADAGLLQRAFGLLKVNGYQYPVAIEDDGRLLIAYSVNKEDIECGIVPLRALPR
jgi:hypothetical protein